MEKKLVSKTQKIVPEIPQYTSRYSSTITSNLEDEELVKRKGTIFGVYEVSGPMEFETAVISKTISDILQDAYFQSENISPIQSLERAILETKDKLTKNENSLQSKNADLELNIVASVLWGNVLYVVQHGRGNAIIMREGESKSVKFLAEGNFAAASGIVKNDDVVVLSTTSFGEKYPPETLLRADSSTFKELPPESSCLMIKFSIDTEFTPSEQIDFGVKKSKKKSKADLKKFKSLLNNNSETKNDSEGIVSIKTQRSKKKMGVKVLYLVAAILLVAFAVSITLTLKNGGNQEQPEENPQTNVEETQPKTENREEVNGIAEKNTETDETFFYDLTLVENSVSPTNILATENQVFLADPENGTLYVSDSETPKFSLSKTNLFGISDMFYEDGFINFHDNESYKRYNIETASVETYINETELGITFPYLDFIYEVKGNTISKYSQADGKSLWTQSPDLSSATDMVIDVNIYILSSTGEILMYSAGERGNFELKNMDISLNNPKKIALSPNSDKLYIADTGNMSVVVVDINGNFEKRISHTNKDLWNDIRDISVSPDGSKIYVLNETSVYEVSL